MLNHNNMPGAGSISDTMEFMRKMWSSMGTPSMGIPTLSVEEINKKITDLKTVASWLELNMNMLRATIQTLEVQSATLSTLQAMGAILTPNQQDAQKESASAASPFGFSGWPNSTPDSAAATTKADARPSEPEPTVEEMEEDNGDWGAPPDLAQVKAEEDAAASATATAAAAKASADPHAAMVNPNAWWNLLQDQFQKAVGNVLADQGGATPVKPDVASRAAPKKTTKPKAAAKPGTRAKPGVVQSGHSKPVSRKAKTPSSA
ncbi:hypothetical protein FHW67_001880 [Herbaspirillum sp. Sphag1AN]|uniref:PhaM family polyhydroxyalkanoate granule multifunctional regulatory protein n=1 Tax=unclassified Herbaspirillum TaxID=2624150 RepID=UPI00161C5061|nr:MULTISPECIES: PhaM family polyhydroxyalkanoate granule multifunctional regulatory protein [unclassified Herbaspirillum]MBB3212597.1 hypothetical protein [Herbaspirillum sp. Sphag1AN]MBB3245794.1 hypothetical protein [Herbaspirillum sp. Sphag64]